MQALVNDLYIRSYSENATMACEWQQGILYHISSGAPMGSHYWNGGGAKNVPPNLYYFIDEYNDMYLSTDGSDSNKIVSGHVIDNCLVITSILSDDPELSASAVRGFMKTYKKLAIPYCVSIIKKIALTRSYQVSLGQDLSHLEGILFTQYGFHYTDPVDAKILTSDWDARPIHLELPKKKVKNGKRHAASTETAY